MKRVVVYYGVGLLVLLGLLAFIDMEDGPMFLRDICCSTGAFMFALFGRELIIRHPLLVFLVPAILLLLAFLGI